MSGSRRSLGHGWRGSAVLLSILSASTTVVLTILLFLSVFKLGSGSSSFSGTSRLFSGECSQASRLTIFLHLAINIIASIILASSNFFMQVLVAPTRKDVDKAHARGRWLEIGVQSWRNIRFVPITNTIFWLMLAFSTIPLHLIFNSTVIETKGSTDFLFVISTESFTEGADSNGSLSIVGRPGNNLQPYVDEVGTLQNISKSIATGTWEKLNLQDCYQRYNTTTSVFTTYRHAVMVVSNQNETLGQTIDWSPAEVYKNASKDVSADLANIRSPIWDVEYFARTDSYVNEVTDNANRNPLGESLDYALIMNLQTGLFAMRVAGGNETYSSFVQAEYVYMKAYYCLSEPYIVPCKVDIDNQLLGIVCLIGFIKTLLCVIILLGWKHQNPFMTLGDAIESFINIPDQTTIGMCSHSRNDFIHRNVGDIAWKPVSSAWRTPSRRAGSTIPWSIWIWSYAIITSCLGVAAFFYHRAASSRPLGYSYFGQDPRNPEVNIPGNSKDNINVLIIVANLPQLLLSMAYMVYNGLFTRICSEFEWAAFSVKYLPLRVTLKKGQQQSTYRLQLPYHWSIPLLVVSIILHWLFSNCIYVIIYESYVAYWPYDSSITRTLQFSTITILISLVICLGLALVPVILAAWKLPGKMVIAGNCSAVISAACHCVPSFIPSPEQSGSTNKTLVIEEDNWDENSGTARREVVDLATSKLKWGVIPDLGNNRTQPNDTSVGHLSFGSEVQGVGEVVEGDLYSGLQPVKSG